MKAPLKSSRDCCHFADYKSEKLGLHRELNSRRQLCILARLISARQQKFSAFSTIFSLIMKLYNETVSNWHLPLSSWRVASFYMEIQKVISNFQRQLRPNRSNANSTFTNSHLVLTETFCDNSRVSSAGTLLQIEFVDHGRHWKAASQFPRTPTSLLSASSNRIRDENFDQHFPSWANKFPNSKVSFLSLSRQRKLLRHIFSLISLRKLRCEVYKWNSSWFEPS